MIPEDIKNNQHIKEYIHYTMSGLIDFKAYRLADKRDTAALAGKDEMISLPNFFGEWQECSPEEIEKLNNTIRETRRVKYEKALKPNENTKVIKVEEDNIDDLEYDENNSDKVRDEIEKAEKLLAELRKNYAITEDILDEYEGGDE